MAPPHTFRPHIENTIHYEYQSYGSRAGVVGRDREGEGKVKEERAGQRDEQRKQVE